MAYLDQFYDAEAVYPQRWTEAAIAAAEVIRLGQLAQVAETSASLKRRLEDASPARLAEDKRWARRIAHLGRQQARAWMSELETQGEPHRVEPGQSEEWSEISRLAATVDWEIYVQEHHDEVRERCRLVVSWAVNNEKRSFGNRAASRFTVELDRMQAAISR